MTEEEKALRMTIIVDMFLTYGVTASTDRLRNYGNLTKYVPMEVFKQAHRNAMVACEGSWPPGPGAIIAAAKVLAPGKPNPGQPVGLPRWYQRTLGERVSAEKPREIGSRQGGGAIDGALRKAQGES